ncbi:MAG: hypothetical protein FJ014_13675 [Chloroflexi bacterium]|nr:hypothetical protein [Chloroflexota bacterium]
MAQATVQTKLRADQIEGLREFVYHIVAEEGEKALRQIALEDIEQLRRSPVGAIIRLEEKVDHIDKSLNNFREDTERNMSNLRSDMEKLRSDMEKNLSNLRGETHALFAEQGERIAFLQRVVFAVFSLLIGLQIAILIKLFL